MELMCVDLVLKRKELLGLADSSESNSKEEISENKSEQESNQNVI